MQFLAEEVEDVVAKEEGGMQSEVVLRGGQVVKCKWVMLGYTVGDMVSL